MCLCSTISGASVRKTPMVRGWNFLEASSYKCLASWLARFKAQLGPAPMYLGPSMASPCTLGFHVTWWPQSNQTSLHGGPDLQGQVFQWTKWNLHVFYDLALEVSASVVFFWLKWSRSLLSSKWRVHRSWLLAEGMSKDMQPCVKTTRVRWEDIKMP